MASVAAVIDTTKDSRWYFTADQLQQNSPSRKSGLDTDQELNHRQKAAYLIQDMGQRLRVSQLCINTAIVYMHRFYAFHSFTHFHRNGIAAASLFLAAKVEEQPRKIETIIQAANACLEAPDAIKENYQEQAQDLVFNENVLLQTLGFDVAVDHPHTYVVKTCHLVKACKDLGQTSYFLASNSLHLTTMCLQYRPPVVACFCIYLACKWSRWEIPQSTEGKYWFHYVDKSVTLEMLEQLTNEFLVIYEKSPARLKTKLNSCKGLGLNASKGGESQRQMSHGSSSRPPHSSSSSGDHSRSHGSGHHRSSHHHAKQLQPPGGKSSSSQQPIPKPVQSSSSSGVSSTTAGSCRPRPERQDRPMASHAEPHFSAPHRTAGSTKGPLPPLTRGNISDNATTSVVGSSTGPPIPQSTALHQQQRSSAGSHGPDSANYQKNRSIPQQPPDLQQRHSSKLEQRPPHGLKDQKPIDSKSSIKQQHNSYPNQSAPRIQQQQPPYQQPPNYNQAMASRGSQQHNTQSVHNIQKQQPNLVNESSYRHTTTDELSNPATTHNRQNSSPKHNSTKPPSIFSPEWNDKSVANNKTSSSGNGLNIKSNRDSPKKHERRSETPTKREKLQLDSPITPQSQKIQQHEKRSNSAKRLTDTPGMPTMHVPPPAISPFMDTMTNTALPATSINKPQPSLNVSIKRPHSDDLVKQEDGVDFREKKFMKLEPMSSPTSSKRWPLPSDTFGGITSINQQQSLTANNPFDILSKTTFNGIETNPDLVSSLLKESLCTDTKFTPFNNQQPLLQPPPQQQLNLPLHKIEAIKNESLLDDIDVNYLEKIVPIPQIKLESNVIEQEQRIKSEKKKKKEKHKHKDKEKSKDREERKKHKKDKERHKDRGGSGVGGGGGGSGATMHEHFAANNDTHNPIKITIPKDKLNLPSQDNMNQMSGFKITIPKDRIKTDVPLPPSTTSSQHQQQQQQQQQQHFHHNQNNQQQQPPPLKIKICKDVVMNTSGSNPNEVGVAHHNSSSGGGTHHSGGGGGSKKKDKDRERSGSGEHQKQNGNNRSNGGGGGGGSTAGGGHGSSRSGSQSSNSNKMQQQQQQHQYNNHSQQQQQQQYNNMYSNATVPPLGSAVPQQLLNHHSASALNNSNRVPSLTPAQLHQQQQSHNDKFINHHQFANSNNNYNNYYQQQQQLSNSNHNTNNGSSNKK